MLTTLLPLLPLLLLPCCALCSQEAPDGESTAHLVPWDGSGDSHPVWVHRQDQRGAYPTVSVSAAGWISPVGRQVLGTGSCPKAKVRKHSSAPGKGEMQEAGGKQDWKNGKGACRKGERISHGERGKMGQSLEREV